jgi:tRNA-(ms[2]io[6]A)-hydroxylase
LAPFQVSANLFSPLPNSGRRTKSRHKELPLTRKSIDLLVPTSPAWVEKVLTDFDTFLQDHANCERKASALAMSFVVKYPDRKFITAGLIDLAQEELDHFRQVFEIMEQRGIPLAKDEPDEYVNQLLAAARHGSDNRFLDRMLISSVIECRGAERFGLLADALDEGPLKSFYERLRKSETKHGHLFVQLLLKKFEENAIYPRLGELMQIEAEIIQRLDLRPAMH